MKPFAYARARDMADALGTLDTGPAALLAGGTELLNWMRLGLTAPERVLDISRVAGLDRIERGSDGKWRIGALAKLAAVAAEAQLARELPVLAQAIASAASPQLRNLATLGGNLLQRTRCAYFRAEVPTPCNKRVAGSGCSAKDGFDEQGAIFGWSDACVAVHPADPPVALAALDAVLVLRSAAGERRVPIADFHCLPGADATRETELSEGEIITAIEIPAPASTSAYIKVRERESYEYALVSAAAVLDLEGSRIGRARLALGSVALKPWRLAVAEERLRGVWLHTPQVAQAIDAAFAAARPLAGNGWKLQLARNAALCAIEQAANEGRAP